MSDKLLDNPKSKKEFKDEFGDRMKMYEGAEGKRKVMKGLPICIRLDGKNFSRMTKNIARPFCKEFHNVMIEVTKTLVKYSNANVGYTQSDEISLIIYDNGNYNQELYFDGKIQKLTSVLASIASSTFTRLQSTIPRFSDDLVIFDCRVWGVPNVSEAINTLVWRELDATKNSVSMLARCHFSHKSLYGKSRAVQLDMLIDKGVNWMKEDPGFKRGTYVLHEYETLDKVTLKNKLKHLPPDRLKKALASIENTPKKIVKSIIDINLPPIMNMQNRESLLMPFSYIEVSLLKRVAYNWDLTKLFLDEAAIIMKKKTKEC